MREMDDSETHRIHVVETELVGYGAR